MCKFNFPFNYFLIKHFELDIKISQLLRSEVGEDSNMSMGSDSQDGYATGNPAS